MIPVRNIYYMLVYAWDALEASSVVNVDEMDPHDVLELLGGVLCNGATYLLRRGLDRDYVEHNETISGLRGRLDIETSLKRVLLPQALAHCRFDELSHDVAHNRVIRATLRRLALADELNGALRNELAGLHRRFAGVADVPLSRQLFRGIQLHRNNHYYSLVLEVCRLVAEHVLINESTGRAEFRSFERDEGKMRRLFERFVRNFYRIHSSFVVSAPRFEWYRREGSAEDLSVLPGMQTDLVLRTPERTIVVDTKFTKRTLETNRGGRQVKTGHLYQLNAYMTNMAASGDYPGELEGMLIYPETEEPVHLDYRLLGRRVRVVTVNMNQPWHGVRDELLGLLD